MPPRGLKGSATGASPRSGIRSGIRPENAPPYVGGKFLFRYVTRPGLSDERAQIKAAWHVELTLKTP